MSPALPKTPPAGDGAMVLWSMLDGADHLQNIDDYIAKGGYEQLKRALKRTPDELVGELKTAGIRGRGGAGFPTGLKLSFIPKDSPKPKYVVCNADESEPCTYKDRELIERLPHLLVEGCLIASHMIGSEAAFIYIRGEFLEAFEVLKAAADQAREKGFIGSNVLGTEWSPSLVIHRGAGAYICGEETALLSSLNGWRGQPTVKPPFPAVSGLYESPTLLNNVETLSSIPRILAVGGKEYSELGVTKSGTGTKLFSLSGNVARPGNYELDLGTPLRHLIEELGGGVPDGYKLKAIIPGGSSMPILMADQIDTGLDFDSMTAAGTMLGSGSVVAIDERTCMAQLALRVAQFYTHESCGKCTPCREGTKWGTDIITRIVACEGKPGDIDLLYSVCDRILGNCLCPLGDAMAMPIMSYIEKFREDFDRYLEPGFEPPADSGVAEIANRAVKASGVTKPGVNWLGKLDRSQFVPFSDGPSKPERTSTPVELTTTKKRWS